MSVQSFACEICDIAFRVAKYEKDSGKRELEIDDVIATVPGYYFPYTCLQV